MKITATIEGLKIFDPRDGKYKVSDNPALIMLDWLKRFGDKKHKRYAKSKRLLKYVCDMANLMEVKFK